MEITREHKAGLEKVLDVVESRSLIRKNGMIDGHILQRDLHSWIAQASAAPEQEPVAWMTPSGGFYRDKKVAETGLHGHVCKVTPVYSHPSAEIERLRAENKRLLYAGQALEADFSSYRREVEHKDEACTRRADAAEQKLAEAQALLSKGVLVGRAELSLVRSALKRDAEERGMLGRGEMLVELDRSVERFDTFLSATAQPAGAGASEFKREQRYLVLKLKRLDEEQMDRLNTLLNVSGPGRRSFAGAAVDCVVVEADWPEYPVVWKMIEDRVAAEPAKGGDEGENS